MTTQKEHEEQVAQKRHAAEYNTVSQYAADLCLSIGNDLDTRREDYAKRGGSAEQMREIVKMLGQIKHRMTQC